MEESALITGFLEKKGSLVKSWRRRLFILTPLRLRYHLQHSYEPCKGEIKLGDVTDVSVFGIDTPGDGRRGSFFGKTSDVTPLMTLKVSTEGRELLLRGPQPELEKWLEHIKSAVARFRAPPATSAADAELVRRTT